MKFAIRKILVFSITLLSAVMLSSCSEISDNLVGGSNQTEAMQSRDIYRELKSVDIPVEVYPHSRIELSANESGLAEIRSISFKQNEPSDPNESANFCDDLSVAIDKLELSPVTACNVSSFKTQKVTVMNSGKKVKRMIATVTGPVRYTK